MHQHIPKEVVQKFRESLKSDYASRQFHLDHPEFCERSMDYFEKMGAFAENAATKDDITSVTETVKECNRRALERVDEVDRRVGALELRRAEDRQQIEKHAAEINELRHQNTNMSIEMRHVVRHTDEIPAIRDSVNSLHDTVNAVISMTSKSSPAAQSKPATFWSKIPTPLWAAIGALLIAFSVGTATAIVYIQTGQIINFGGG